MAVFNMSGNNINIASRPLKNGQSGPSTACAAIVKPVDKRIRAKTSINELLRD